jgi:hypothetical protein
MNAVVIEHVKVGDLPESWRAKLPAPADARVTVRIEEETASNEAAPPASDNPLFGLWRDRGDLADVDAYVRKLRAARF